MYEKEPLHNQGRTVIGLYKIWFKHIIDIELYGLKGISMTKTA